MIVWLNCTQEGLPYSLLKEASYRKNPKKLNQPDSVSWGQVGLRF